MSHFTDDSDVETAGKIWDQLRIGCRVEMGDEVYEVLTDPNKNPGGAFAADVVQVKDRAGKEWRLTWEKILVAVSKKQTVTVSN